MDLSPHDIQEKQFHDTFRGYSHEQVDLFLDEVAEAFDRVYRENQALHHQIRQLEKEYESAKGTEDMLKRTLITAQKTAEEAIEEAKSKAQGMLVASERKAQEIEAGSETKAAEIVADAHRRERELQVRIEGLKHFEAEFRARLHAFIESQLRVLEEGPIAQPPPIDTSPATAPEKKKAEAETIASSPGISEAVIVEESDIEGAVVAADGLRTADVISVESTEESKAEGESEEVEEVQKRPAPASAASAAIKDIVARVAPTSSSQPALDRSAKKTSDTLEKQSGSTPAGPPQRSGETRPHETVSEDEEDERSIKKLFWGEE